MAGRAHRRKTQGGRVKVGIKKLPHARGLSLPHYATKGSAGLDLLAAIDEEIELLPGHYAVPQDAGVAVMRGSTEQGIELVMQKFYDINTMITKYRIDTLFGVVNKQPEMSGVLLFSQP